MTREPSPLPAYFLVFVAVGGLLWSLGMYLRGDWPVAAPLAVGCPDPLRPMRVGDLLYIDGGQIVRVQEVLRRTDD